MSYSKVHHVKYLIEARAYMLAVLITKTHVVHIQLTGKGVGTRDAGTGTVRWPLTIPGGPWF